MAKQFFFILFLTVHAVCFSQAPTHFSNTYTIGEDNPLIDFNHQSFCRMPSGEVLYLSYNGKAGIIGNNYFDSIKNWNRINLLNTFPYFLKTRNEVWLMGANGMAVIKNNTLIKSQKHNWVNCWFTPAIKHEGVNVINFKANIITLFDTNGLSTSRKMILPDSLQSANINGKILLLPGQQQRIWFFHFSPGKLSLYRLDENRYQMEQVISHSIPDNTGDFDALFIKDENNFILKNLNDQSAIICANGKLTKTNSAFIAGDVTDGVFQYFINHLVGLVSIKHFFRNNYSVFYHANNHFTGTNTALFSVDKKVNPNILIDSTTASIFLGTENKPIRSFSLIQKYPRLFNNTHSNACFSLSQDEAGKIWAGSYNGAVSVIDKGKEKVQPLSHLNFMVMNGALHFNNKHYLLGEGLAGLQELSFNDNKKVSNENSTGFYLYQSPTQNKIYYGKSASLGLWITDADALIANKPNWNKVDSSKGMKLHNIITITEDKKGRVWCGHHTRGIAVYNPATDKAQTWFTENNESPFGAMSSLTDKWGTVWLGSRGKGLWYYNEYNKPATPASCNQINHPLLNDPAITIMSITAYYGKENYLVLGCYNKICLLNLDSFYQKKKILLHYLNPQEASFSSFTEQNTMFTSHTDSSIWFSTSDMVYNWDINKWLQLPVYKPAVRLLMHINDSTIQMTEGKPFYLSPTNNNLSFELRLSSADLMPRYLNMELVKKGDTLAFGNPGIQQSISFQNLGSGSYTLYVRIFESDGSITLLNYPIVIKKFLWQQWWFWLLISLMVTGTIFYLLNLKRKKLLAEQKAKTREAALHSYKAEQDKKMADLRLLTLSSQFRPHFILNALNTIGARMDGNPDTESVLSRLGESVNLIFNHAKAQKTLHSFQNEWKLVANIIHIHRLMYLKTLETTLPEQSEIENWNDLQVPMGLLQIPVENALLHGLGNKDSGLFKLQIELKDIGENILLAITDNGVGRKKAAGLSNFSKHGTGTRNLNEIIEIINAVNENKIRVAYEDDIFQANDEKFGTRILITIPKTIAYES